MFYISIALVVTNLVTFYYLIKSRKRIKRKDLNEILKALQDFQSRGQCTIQITRLNQDNLMEWSPFEA